MHRDGHQPRSPGMLKPWVTRAERFEHRYTIQRRSEPLSTEMPADGSHEHPVMPRVARYCCGVRSWVDVSTVVTSRAVPG